MKGSEAYYESHGIIYNTDLVYTKESMKCICS